MPKEFLSPMGGKVLFLSMSAAVAIFNLYYFMRNQRWKRIINEIEKMPGDVRSSSMLVANIICVLMISVLFLLLLT